MVYWNFLSNVKNRKVENYIVPFPSTSVDAARFFWKNKIKFDIIYIDASHEELEVRCDTLFWWDCLRPGGIMYCDDYYWTGVKKAVGDFVTVKDLLVYVDERHAKWKIYKDQDKDKKNEYNT